jgi:hypothetical protein
MKMWLSSTQERQGDAATAAVPSLVPPDLSTQPWDSPPPPGEKVALGTDAHKRLFSRTLIDTFNPYRPAVIDWPKLDPDAQARLTSLPIWDIAVQNEGEAMRRVKAYADVVADPLVKTAVELNAFEEGRHKLVLSNLVEAYGIALEPEPVYPKPKDPEWSFMITGYGECVDSFFAFGLFDAAKRSGFFPPELVDTFEPVIAEEGRHILFFVNWVAWRRRTMPWWRRPWFELKVLAVWVVIARRRLSIAASARGSGKGSGKGSGRDQAVAQAPEQFGDGIDVAQLMDACLAENDRRLGVYDPRLIRPTFVPAMVRLARRYFVKPAAA